MRDKTVLHKSYKWSAKQKREIVDGLKAHGDPLRNAEIKFHASGKHAGSFTVQWYIPKDLQWRGAFRRNDAEYEREQQARESYRALCDVALMWATQQLGYANASLIASYDSDKGRSSYYTSSHSYRSVQISLEGPTVVRLEIGPLGGIVNSAVPEDFGRSLLWPIHDFLARGLYWHTDLSRAELWSQAIAHFEKQEAIKLVGEVEVVDWLFELAQATVNKRFIEADFKRNQGHLDLSQRENVWTARFVRSSYQSNDPGYLKAECISTDPIEIAQFILQQRAVGDDVPEYEKRDYVKLLEAAFTALDAKYTAQIDALLSD